MAGCRCEEMKSKPKSYFSIFDVIYLLANIIDQLHVDETHDRDSYHYLACTTFASHLSTNAALSNRAYISKKQLEICVQAQQEC